VVPLEAGGGGAPQATGYLAESVEEYCDAITRVLVMPQADRLRITAAAQRHAAKFSTENFTAGFLGAIAAALPPRAAGAGRGSGGAGSGGSSSSGSGEREECEAGGKEEEGLERTGGRGSGEEAAAAAVAAAAGEPALAPQRGPARRAVRRA
jgi:hypothetical protein